MKGGGQLRELQSSSCARTRLRTQSYGAFGPAWLPPFICARGYSRVALPNPREGAIERCSSTL